MNQEPVAPRASAGTVPLAPFVLLGGLWAVIGCAWLAWAAGRIVAAATGRPAGPPFGSGFGLAVLNGNWAIAFPGLNHPVIAGVFAVLLALGGSPIVAAGVWWQRHRTRAEDPLPSLARLSDVIELAPARMAARAQALRPSLAAFAADELAPEQTGMPLGTLIHHRPTLGRGSGPWLSASWEDTLLALMGPRVAKTTRLTVPVLLAAPGPALATSNRADLWATTHAARATAGTVWVFDPQAITRTGRTWWWNPLASVTSVEDASRLAGHFLQPIRGGRAGDDFWLKAAEDLLCALFLAAASSGQSLLEVQAWQS